MAQEVAKMAFDDCGSGRCLRVEMDNREGGGGDK